MSQVQIAVAHEGLRRIDPRRIPASLLNNVLGGSGFSSRLMVQLRSNAGLTYSVRSGFALRRRPGRFGVTTFTRAKQMRPAIELLLSEIEAIRGPRPPDALELRNAKAFSVGHFALGLETSQSVMASLVNLDVYGLPEDSLDSYRARIGAVTQSEVAALAKDLLHPGRAAIVVVGPAEALLPELVSFGSVEVVEW
jgi:zinc protease